VSPEELSERLGYLLPIVEGQLATRALEREVIEHHEHCPRCSHIITEELCPVVAALCGQIEMAQGQYEADLAKWEISDNRARMEHAR